MKKNIGKIIIFLFIFILSLGLGINVYASEEDKTNELNKCISYLDDISQTYSYYLTSDVSELINDSKTELNNYTNDNEELYIAEIDEMALSKAKSIIDLIYTNTINSYTSKIENSDDIESLNSDLDYFVNQETFDTVEELNDYFLNTIEYANYIYTKNFYPFINVNFDDLDSSYYDSIKELYDKYINNTLEENYLSGLNFIYKEYGYEDIYDFLSEYKLKLDFENERDKKSMLLDSMFKMHYSDDLINEIFSLNTLSDLSFTQTFNDYNNEYNKLEIELNAKYLSIQSEINFLIEKERVNNYLLDYYDNLVSNNIYSDDDLLEIKELIDSALVVLSDKTNIEDIKQLKIDTLSQIDEYKKLKVLNDNKVDSYIESSDGLSNDAYLNIQKENDEDTEKSYNVYFYNNSDNDANYSIVINDDFSKYKSEKVYILDNNKKYNVNYTISDNQLIIYTEVVGDIYVVEYNPPYLAMALTFGSLFTLLILAIVFIKGEKHEEE